MKIAQTLDQQGRTGQPAPSGQLQHQHLQHQLRLQQLKRQQQKKHQHLRPKPKAMI